MAENNKSNQNNKAEAVIIAQEPGTRNQEPGTRNQEPGTRNQEPGTRNKIAVCEYGKVDQYAKYIPRQIDNSQLNVMLQNNSYTSILVPVWHCQSAPRGYGYSKYKNGSIVRPGNPTEPKPKGDYFVPVLLIN